MRHIEAAIIAAAGLGSRLGLGLPKCMIEIDGKTVLSRMIEILEVHAENIYVVVGYREELIIDYCAQFHRNVVVVRNPNYRVTNTAQSHYLAAKNINGKVLYIDGDLVLEKKSFSDFINHSKNKNILVGVTKVNSDNAVFANIDKVHDDLFIRKFDRANNTSDYEWANIFIGPANIMQGAQGYVYERLAEFLPLCAFDIKLSEIDTIDDLERTKLFIRQNN